MSFNRSNLTRSLAEFTALAAAALALPLIQSQFPITLGPAWLLAGALGLPLVAGLLLGFLGVGAVAAGSLAAWVALGGSAEAGVGGLTAVLETAVVAWGCRHGLPFSPLLDNPRHVLSFVIVAALAAAVRGVAAALTATLLGQAPLHAAVGAAALEWMTGLLMAPAAVVWLRGAWLDARDRHRVGEALVLAVVVGGLTWAWFGGANPHPLNLPMPMLAVILGFGNWIAFRFYVRGMASFFIVIGGIFTLGAAARGTFAPVVPLTAGPLEQHLWLAGLSVVLVFHLVIAAVAKDYAVREREREALMVSAQKHAERLSDVNSRLSLQSLEIADQADELGRQRDEFERLARELTDKQIRLHLLESAVVHARDAVIVLEGTQHPTRGRGVLYVNSAFTQMTGYAAAEVLGRSLHFLRGEKTDAATLDHLRVALDTRQPFNCELLNYRRDGVGIWVSISIVPVVNVEKECTHFVMIQRDITDRKKAEEALQASEAKFREIFEVAPAGVSLTDAEGRFSSCNPAFAALLGRSMDEIIGHKPGEFTHPEDTAAQDDFTAAVLDGRLETYQFRKRYIRPDGSITWTELSFAAVRGPNGEYQAGLGVSVDVSTRMTLEEQLRQAQKMEALGQLAGGVAHDFNNLLTAVLGNLGLVQLPDDHAAKPLLRTVELAASRAADLTRKLLGYARRNQLMISSVTPAAMIGEVVDILRRTIDPRIEIRTDVRTDEPVAVDATLVNQALFNLCLNARDVMPHGGQLTLAADHVAVTDEQSARHAGAGAGTYLRLSVSDTGSGMDETVKERIFEPFFTTKGVGRGTGLGLPMVHGILKQHGGWVTCETQLGAGSRFDLYLPLVQRCPAPPQPRFGLSPTCDVSTPPPEQAAAATILLVDDEEMIRVLGRTILESNGYRVLEATDGVEAVEVFTQEREAIDLVILDVTMPRLSGRDAFEQIITQEPTARVLLSSGYSTEDLSEVEGTLGLLTKPYRPKDLLGATYRALRNMPISVKTPD
jgi:PAS domain S-box-containing protein